MTIRRLSLCTAAALLCAVSLAGCHDAQFGNVYSKSQEQQMGAQMADQINHTEKIDNDPQDNTRIESIAQPIFAQAHKWRPDVTFQIRIIDSADVNAFSLPGGYVYLYTGLLDKLGTDDDAIAAVIGHESAHVVLRHAVKQMSDSGIKGALVEVLGITTNNPTVFNAADYAYEMEQLHYSREDEYQADKYGLMFAYDAGYDPYGMIRTFQKLEDVEKATGTEPAYAEDHPITKNRILRVQDLIKQLRDNNGIYPDLTPPDDQAGPDKGAAQSLPTTPATPAPDTNVAPKTTP
jgi:predicted Zn-dependent protease